MRRLNVSPINHIGFHIFIDQPNRSFSVLTGLWRSRKSFLIIEQEMTRLRTGGLMSASHVL